MEQGWECTSAILSKAHYRGISKTRTAKLTLLSYPTLLINGNRAGTQQTPTEPCSDTMQG